MNKVVEEVIDILKFSQDDLMRHIEQNIEMNIVSTDYMIYSKSDIPKPMLCVHLDTINTYSANCKIIPKRDFEYDEHLGILGLTKNSPLHCLGGDDRAGVWIALQLIDYMEASGDFKYDIGFFKDEEIGCNGSTSYRKSSHKFNTTCYIGLDRKSTKGVQEVALYGDDNKELIEIFNNLEYVTEMGSVTDASNLSGDVACVNLSVGYDNEHTKDEVIYIYSMLDTLRKLIELDLPPLIFTPNYDHYYDSNPWKDEYDTADLDSGAWYVELLEEENDIFRSTLEYLGIDVEQLLIDGSI